MSYLTFPYNAILPIEDGGQIFFSINTSKLRRGKAKFFYWMEGVQNLKKTISKTPRLLDR